MELWRDFQTVPSPKPATPQEAALPEVEPQAAAPLQAAGWVQPDIP